MSEYLTRAAAKQLADGKPYGLAHDPWTFGYRSHGGSYLIAGNGRQRDDGQPCDLLLVLPAPMGDSRVIELRPTVNPDFTAAVRAIVDVEVKR